MSLEFLMIAHEDRIFHQITYKEGYDNEITNVQTIPYFTSNEIGNTCISSQQLLQYIITLWNSFRYYINDKSLIEMIEEVSDDTWEDLPLKALAMSRLLLEFSDMSNEDFLNYTLPENFKDTVACISKNGRTRKLPNTITINKGMYKMEYNILEMIYFLRNNGMMTHYSPFPEDLKKIIPENSQNHIREIWTKWFLKEELEKNGFYNPRLEKYIIRSSQKNNIFYEYSIYNKDGSLFTLDEYPIPIGKLNDFRISGENIKRLSDLIVRLWDMGRYIHRNVNGSFITINEIIQSKVGFLEKHGMKDWYINDLANSKKFKYFVRIFDELQKSSDTDFILNLYSNENYYDSFYYIMLNEKN